MGPDHPDTLITRNNIAAVLDKQGKYDEALEAYQEVFDKRKVILGPDHPDTLITQSNIALVLLGQGKYEEALKAYQDVAHRVQTDYRPPLHKAVSSGNLNLVRNLIKRGTNVNQKDVNGFTPLYYAISYGNLNIAVVLLESGANTNNLNPDQREVLINYIIEHYKGDTELLMNKLLEGNLNSGLIDAAKNNDLSRVEDYIRRGASVNTIDENNWTPLHYAVLGSNQKVVQLLLENKADPSLENKNGETPLDLAWEKLSQETRNQESLQEIVGLLVSVTQETIDVSLLRAVERGKLNLVEYLIKNGADVNAVDNSNRLTPLHHAAYIAN